MASFSHSRHNFPSKLSEIKIWATLRSVRKTNTYSYPETLQIINPEAFVFVSGEIVAGRQEKTIVVKFRERDIGTDLRSH
jgi:hypothetical protein